MQNMMERMIIADAYEEKGLEGCIKEIVPTEKEALKLHKKDMKEKGHKFNQLVFKSTYVASVLRVIVGVLAYRPCGFDKENVLEVVKKIEELTKDLRDAIEEAK